MDQSDLLQHTSDELPGEEALELDEWYGASRFASDLVPKHWGDNRAIHLVVHHTAVADLISQYDWPVARKYDINVRRKSAADRSHELTTLDRAQLALVTGEVEPPGQPLTNNWSTSAEECSPVPNIPYWNEIKKRLRESNEGDTRPVKTPRRTKCSRCGTSGHNKAKCKSTVTSAGAPSTQGVFRVLTLDQASRSPGVQKFHRFCDIFRVPEQDRLPAPFPVIHSFVLWATADPEFDDPGPYKASDFEPVSVQTVKEHLVELSDWHLVQGFPEPLSKGDRERINFSLRGVEKLSARKRSRPIRPPVTLEMLATLKNSL